MRAIVFVATLIGAMGFQALLADEVGKRVSGPQVGDNLPSLKARGVLDDEAGKEFDIVAAAEGRPVVLFFIHEVTRPSVNLSRLVLNYAASRRADGLHSGLIFVTADAAETENWLQRASAVLPRGIPTGIAPGGADGPPGYGLHRQVQVTVIVAKGNKVTANFASVQPTPDVDAPKIAEAIAAAVGGKPPTLEELQRLSGVTR
jgi:hypothetical protein